MTEPTPSMPNYEQPNVTPKGVPLITDNHKYGKPLSKLAFQMMKGKSPGVKSIVRGRVHISHRKIKWS